MADCEESLRSGEATIFEFNGSSDYSEVHNTFTNIWRTGELSDIVLICNGGQIKSHRLVLRTYCSKLTLQDLGKAYVYLDHIKINILRLVLNYVYNNKVAVPKDDLRLVAGAAKELGIEGLYRKCNKAYLSTTEINTGSALKIWVEASEEDETDTAERALSFALKNFVKIQKTESFKSLASEYFKNYILDLNLQARTPEERLNAALNWVRSDPGRVCCLEDILTALPLKRMASWYLDGLLGDPTVNALPRIRDRIQNAQAVNEVNGMEKCYIFIGATLSKTYLPRWTTEVNAVRIEKNYEITKLGNFASAQFQGSSSCCVMGDRLYVTGFGKHDQIWGYDLNKKEEKPIGRLCIPKEHHASCVSPDGCLYVLGGENFGISTTVEKHGNGQSKTVDHYLPFYTCITSTCCFIRDKILLCGTMDNNLNHQIIIWDPQIANTVHTLEVQGYVHCIIECQDHILMVSDENTAVAKTLELLEGKQECIKLCCNYGAANKYCGVITSEDDQCVILIGGSPTEKTNQCYIYEAKLDDIVNNTAKGWTPVANVDWKTEESQLYATGAAYLKFED